MTKPFSLAFGRKMVTRLTGKEAVDEEAEFAVHLLLLRSESDQEEIPLKTIKVWNAKQQTRVEAEDRTRRGRGRGAVCVSWLPPSENVCMN